MTLVSAALEMDFTRIFTCLEEVSAIGRPPRTSGNSVKEAVNFVKGNLNDLDKRGLFKKKSWLKEHEIICEAQKILGNKLLDHRTELACLVLVLLGQLEPAQNEAGGSLEESVPNTHSAEAKSSCIFSVKQTKAAELSVKYVMYTVVLGCLDRESAMFIKMKIAKDKYVCGSQQLLVHPDQQHSFLVFVMRQLLRVFKNNELGVFVRSNLLGEYFSSLLHLCFSPTAVKYHQKETEEFRNILEDLMARLDRCQMLQYFLLFKGLLASEDGNYLQPVVNSILLRRFILRENGVLETVNAALVICDVRDWRQSEVIAASVTGCRVHDMDEFYSSVGSQIVDILMHRKVSLDTLRVVCSIILQLCSRSPTLVSAYIFRPLILPITLLTSETGEDLPSDEELTEAVSNVHYLYVELMVPSASLHPLIEPILHPLIAVASLPPTCHLKTAAQHVLVRYLSQLEVLECKDTLLALSGLEFRDTSPPMHRLVRLKPSPNVIRVVKLEDANRNDIFREDDSLTECIVSILNSLKMPGVLVPFYQALGAYVDFTVLNHMPTVRKSLITEQNRFEAKFKSLRKVALITGLLSYLSEKDELTKNLFSDLSAAVPFIDSLLLSGCQYCEDEVLKITQNTFLMNAVMLISVYVNNQVLKKQMSFSDWEGLKVLVPTLSRVKGQTRDSAIKACVEDLHFLVLTHGAAGNTSSSTATCSRVRPIPKKTPDRIPVYDVSKITSLATSIPSKTRQSMEAVSEETEEGQPLSLYDLMNSPKPPEDKRTDYQKAIDDLCSPHLPVRGHALLELRKMIHRKDKEAIENRDRLLTIFEHNLKDEDSYLYLMAVEGLATLCNAYPEKIIPILIHEVSNDHHLLETRVKIVEALTRAAYRLGPLMPKYKNEFLNCLLNGTRDPEPLIRASCFSNLGTVCKGLRYSVGPLLYEIFQVIYMAVTLDSSPEVRRAAVLVVTMLLQGLGMDSFQVLRDIMKDLYRELKLIMKGDSDDTVKLHAQLAIDEIDKITREFLAPRISLTKHIYIADLPPQS